MIEEYLKIFNDYLDAHDINGALNYIDKIFIDPNYLKFKNLFLYLLGCITELPPKYLDYVKTLSNYDLNIPVDYANGDANKEFRKAILFHYFIKARNIYYEYLDKTNSSEFKRALLILFNLANGVKKNNNKIITKLYNEKNYYDLYAFVHDLVMKHPAYGNFYILDILLKDYITKDYFYTSDNKKYQSVIEELKHKNYEHVLEVFQKIGYREEENVEIKIICDVLNCIIKEKAKMSFNEIIIKDNKSLDKEMFLDFLISAEDVIEKEGFIVLNPESEEINKEMHDLAYYLPNLSAYEIGNIEHQVVINKRRKFVQGINASLYRLKNDAYNKGDSFAYIEYALEQMKYSIPAEIDAAKLAQSYFRVGLIDEGLNALKLAIGLKAYNDRNNSNILISTMLYHYMLQEYFANKREKKLAKNRQK